MVSHPAALQHFPRPALALFAPRLCLVTAMGDSHAAPHPRASSHILGLPPALPCGCSRCAHRQGDSGALQQPQQQQQQQPQQRARIASFCGSRSKARRSLLFAGLIGVAAYLHEQVLLISWHPSHPVRLLRQTSSRTRVARSAQTSVQPHTRALRPLQVNDGGQADWVVEKAAVRVVCQI